MRARVLTTAMLTLALGAGVSGCALSRLPAPTLAQSRQALILGLPNARFLPTDVTALQQEFVASTRREIEYRRSSGQHGPLPPAELLAISGGGDNGAFGGGVLLGWTARGDRPSFKGVTGVSTGALTAPFAFLGPDYDAQLKAVYTDTTNSDIFNRRGMVAGVTQDSLSDTGPLKALITRLLDDRMIERIGQEYEKGRLLLIMSSDLDTGEPCIWNVGAIAASGNPGARALIIQILLASSAIPAAFPPVMINLDVDGRQLQEMHADGGVFAQTFLYPPGIDVAEAVNELGTVHRRRDAYIIRNGRLHPPETEVKRSTLSIATRAVGLMISSSGLNDMIRIYATTSRDHVSYHLAYVDDDFTEASNSAFDRTYMRSLFQYGYDRALAGVEWKTKPPGWDQ